MAGTGKKKRIRSWRVPVVRLPKKRAGDPWAHALQRMRERHSPDAQFWDLFALGLRAGRVHSAWKSGKASAEGLMVAEESDGSAVVMVPWRGEDIMVVYDPDTKVLRTVLPTAKPIIRVREPT